MPTPEETWLLQFANETEPEDQGRPWGDGTAIAARKKLNLNPWDEGCRVTSLFGGYAAIMTMREKLEAAILQAASLQASGVPFGQCGHVYFTDWRFNPLRDISNNNVTFQPGTGPDPTALGLILRLMNFGIQVRALLWLTPFWEGYAGFKPHIAEHFWMAEIVRRENERLLKKYPSTNAQIGVVGLDMRVPLFFPQAVSHHQKMMVIRVGNVNVAFCGGVDLAFTRRDAPDALHPFDPAHPKFLAGDWQSGNGIPAPKPPWPRPAGVDYYTSVDVALPKDVQWSPDLPVEIFGEHFQTWHDQHLMIEGPMVATLEAQFGERWRDNGRIFDLLHWYTKQSWFVGQVIFSTERAFDSATDSILPLDLVNPIAPLPGATAKVQLWRTIPLRRNRLGDVFTRGEYTLMAGVAKATQAARELIWIFDQYFWSRELARLINSEVKNKSSLHIIIILPPHADGSEVRGSTTIHAHHARRLAIEALVSGLNLAQLGRVQVLDLWHPDRNLGIYCHAKEQTYDGSLLVCGSGNLNRRSLSCDSELDCAVLDSATVANHQRGLWELLFPNTAWPNLDLNTAGNGAAFFSQFMQATSPINPASKTFLIPDPWMPGRSRQLPTIPPTLLESDPNDWMFDEVYKRILDPTSFSNMPSDERLDFWSYKIESPYSRGQWRTS